jgi:hypothetical protein
VRESAVPRISADPMVLAAKFRGNRFGGLAGPARKAHRVTGGGSSSQLDPQTLQVEVYVYAASRHFTSRRACC